MRRDINPLLPSGAYMRRRPNFDFLFKKGPTKKIPMSVATMSRLTKRTYLKLCPEKLRKKNSGSKGLEK